LLALLVAISEVAAQTSVALLLKITTLQNVSETGGCDRWNEHKTL